MASCGCVGGGGNMIPCPDPLLAGACRRCMCGFGGPAGGGRFAAVGGGMPAGGKRRLTSSEDGGG
jgi:hypothetical protein